MHYSCFANDQHDHMSYNNKYTLFIAINSIFHERMEHIGLDCHFIREMVEKKEIIIHYFHTSEQPIDLLTKSTV